MSRIVMKFGGTSLGTPERMKAVAKIIQREEQAVIVLSAISGTTDTLHQITTLWQKEKSISDKVKALQTHYNAFIEELLQQVDLKKKDNYQPKIKFNKIWKNKTDKVKKMVWILL